MNISSLKRELETLRDPERAAGSMAFFKTKKGQYGAGDVFLGIDVPNQRKLAKKYQNLPLSALQELLHSPYHEFRLTGLFILVLQYQKGTFDAQKHIARFYFTHKERVNNWDLVDASAHHILGDYLLAFETKNKGLHTLTELARSENLWDRRIAVVSSWAFTKAGNPKPIFLLTEYLLDDSEDLIHKAVGWMLREVGKCCGQEVLDEFLEDYAIRLPRTSLRYALEHHPTHKRLYFMNQKM